MERRCVAAYHAICLGCPWQPRPVSHPCSSLTLSLPDEKHVIAGWAVMCCRRDCSVWPGGNCISQMCIGSGPRERRNRFRQCVVGMTSSVRFLVRFIGDRAAHVVHAATQFTGGLVNRIGVSFLLVGSSRRPYMTSTAVMTMLGFETSTTARAVRGFHITERRQTCR